MKENWTYKTLGEVCNIDYGTRVVQKKDKGSTYFVYGGGGATFMIDRFNREDCFIVSRFAMSQKCTRFVKGKFFLNDSGLSVSTNNEELSQKFLDKVLLANNDNIYLMGKGMAQLNLDMPTFRKLLIPVPPLSEQQRIVEELDLLSSIIEKKKEQLKEYDKLAQSLFYDMFGDPVTNEKGWEEDCIDNTCKITCGQDYKAVQDDNGQYPIYGTGGIMGWANQYRCPKNTVIIGRKGNINNPLLVKVDFWNVDTAFGVTPNKEILDIYYFFFFCKAFDFTLLDVSVTIPSLRRTDILKIKLPLPPLSLQQDFAERVEKIEQQKSLVQQSIVEMQTLFDCTMDKYFG